MKVKGNELSKIITAGDPILKSVAMPVTAFDKKLKFLVNEMKKTMYESNGVGFEAYINPRWTPDGDEKVTDTEGCLSVPNWYGEVERYANVTVKYQDIHGKRKQKKATGLLARCIQHETDHLNGILFIEKANSLHRGASDE